MNYTVQAHVAGHGLHKGKPKTELEIPAMRSRHPLILYNMKPEDQAELPLGQDIVVVLEAQRPKPARDGEKAPDPTRTWNWFWNFVRVATPEDGEPVDPVVMGAVTQPQQAPEAATGAPAPATGREHHGGGGDHREVSIMAQVALKCAVETAGHEGRSMEVDDILRAAKHYHRWMMEASGHEVAPEPAGNGSGVPGHQEGPKEQAQAPQGTAEQGKQPADLPDDDPRESVRGAEPAQEEKPPVDAYDQTQGGEWSDDVPPGAGEVIDHFGDAQPRELEATAHKFDQRDGKIQPITDGTVPEWGAVTEMESFKGDVLFISTRSGTSWRGRCHTLVRRVTWKGVEKFIYTYDRMED